MQFNILTLFPEAILPYTQASILGKAQQSGALTVQVYNIRDYATDKHHTTDDTPYGGGAGMVMKVEPIDNALRAVQGQSSKVHVKSSKTVVLGARGTQFTQHKASEYAHLDSLTLICGRYEGIDQRVIDHLADEEVSVGPYVLAGGELPALTVVEAVARLIPGVLGNPESLSEESFSQPLATTYNLQPTSYLEYPQYTKPEDYKGWNVPPVLLSGDHAAIKAWRESNRPK